MIKVSEFREDSLEGYDLIGFGSGVFHGKHHKSLIEIIENMEVKEKNTFVFSTSGSGQLKYNKALVDILENKGAKLIGEFSCRGYNTYGLFKRIGGRGKGRPNEKDLLNAKGFAQNLLGKLVLI